MTKKSSKFWDLRSSKQQFLLHFHLRKYLNNSLMIKNGLKLIVAALPADPSHQIGFHAVLSKATKGRFRHNKRRPHTHMPVKGYRVPWLQTLMPHEWSEIRHKACSPFAHRPNQRQTAETIWIWIHERVVDQGGLVGYVLSSCCWTWGFPEPPWRPGCRACGAGSKTEPGNTTPPAVSVWCQHWAAACSWGEKSRLTTRHSGATDICVFSTWTQTRFKMPFSKRPDCWQEGFHLLMRIWTQLLISIACSSDVFNPIYTFWFLQLSLSYLSFFVRRIKPNWIKQLNFL